MKNFFLYLLAAVLANIIIQIWVPDEHLGLSPVRELQNEIEIQDLDRGLLTS